MALTVNASNRVLDYNFGGTGYSGGLPASYWLGLSTGTINFDGTITGGAEVVGNGYARREIPNNKSNWSTASNGVLTNSQQITFPESTAPWGTIYYVGLWDAQTNGLIWWYDVLSPSRAVAALTTVIFSGSPPSITVTFNNT